MTWPPSVESEDADTVEEGHGHHGWTSPLGVQLFHRAHQICLSTADLRFWTAQKAKLVFNRSVMQQDNPAIVKPNKGHSGI